MKSRMIALTVALCALLLGCTSLPPDRGAGQIQEWIAPVTGTAASAWAAPSVAAATETMLTEPVDADSAVRIALHHSPRMQSLYAQLGLTQAEVMEATRLMNPTLAILRLDGTMGARRNTASLTQSFLEMIFAGYRQQQGQLQLLQTQQQVAAEVLALEAQVRSAWSTHAATRLIEKLKTKAAQAAVLSADLAEQFRVVGNLSELQWARAKTAAIQTAIEARSQSAAVAQEQSQLLALMGVGTEGPITLLDNLTLPAELNAELATLQTDALRQRFDLQALRSRLDLMTQQAAHTRRWGWLSRLDLAAETERETDGTRLSGVGAAIELPIFNTGGSKRLRASALREAAAAQLQTAELQANADIAALFAKLKAEAQNVADYQGQLLPLQQRIVELSQQRQNFMLIGVFELIDAKRQELAAWVGFVESLRDYHIAHAQLTRALGGAVPTEGSNRIPVVIPGIVETNTSGETP